MKMVDEGEEKVTSPKGKKRPSVILFGNHLALILPSFWPVIHLVTTKNWAKMGFIQSNYVKRFQTVQIQKSPKTNGFRGF